MSVWVRKEFSLREHAVGRIYDALYLWVMCRRRPSVAALAPE